MDALLIGCSNAGNDATALGESTNCSVIATIDSRVVLEEEELLWEVLSLLDFDDKEINKIVARAKKLALVNSEEEGLKEELLFHYQRA